MNRIGIIVGALLFGALGMALMVFMIGGTL